ncbi:hypothetical protein [Pseudoalteromonas phage J2-1_QLiu-2017]|nr:hypothetical protein [Pseudoalteromonas phage J2-1_QLiu-2017]
MKDVKDYEDLFAITEDGQLFSKRSGKFLKQTKLKSGYMSVATKIGGRQGQNVCFRIHRLVAEAYCEPPSKELVEECKKLHYKVVPVNHKDGDKTNNHYTNLEYCSYSDNLKHASSCGLLKPKKGEEHHRSKLTEDEVSSVRKRYVPRCSKNGARALARELGVSHRTISNVINNTTWKSI